MKILTIKVLRTNLFEKPCAC